MPSTAALDVKLDGTRLLIAARGRWIAQEAHRLEVFADEALRQGDPIARAEIDLSEITRLDTLGARLLEAVRAGLIARGAEVDYRAASEAQRALLHEVAARAGTKPPPPVSTNAVVDWLADMGGAVRETGASVAEMIAFLGAMIVTAGRIIARKGRFRWPSVVHQMELIGFRAVPIIMLISFLVGCIIAQQTIFQLQQFGASLYVVDLIGILMLREIGVLLTAIMVAGRSGSAITAELGSMKMREEIDAMRVMGFDPMEVLVVPRIIALMIGVPLLGFLASMAGIFGGFLVSWGYGDISPATFLERLRDSIWISTFMVGVVKAPVMGLVVGMIACIEGFKVKGSAESLGRQTTSSVVKAIFTVIVLDGIFAMVFAELGY